SVQGPQCAARFGRNDGGRARSIVHEGKLTKRASGFNVAHLVPHAIGAGLKLAGRIEVDVKRALFDNIEEISSVPLADYLLFVFVNCTALTETTRRLSYLDALCRNGLFHQCPQDLGALFLV